MLVGRGAARLKLGVTRREFRYGLLAYPRCEGRECIGLEHYCFVDFRNGRVVFMLKSRRSFRLSACVCGVSAFMPRFLCKSLCFLVCLPY